MLNIVIKKRFPSLANYLHINTFIRPIKTNNGFLKINFTESFRS